MGSRGNFLIEAMKEGRQNARLRVTAEGYESAADVCMKVLSDVLDKTESKIEAGKNLSSEEEIMRTELYAMKSKIERNLVDYWQTHYGA